jgi:hypothetical protein
VVDQRNNKITKLDGATKLVDANVSMDGHICCFSNSILNELPNNDKMIRAIANWYSLQMPEV